MKSPKRPNYDGSQPCASIGMDLFYYEYGAGVSFKDSKQDEHNLKKICSNCTFLADCAIYAIHHEEYGFWGGLSYTEREKFRKKYGIKLKKIYL
jgi:hypothetical protein